MSLKVRSAVILAIGMILGVSLSIGSGVLAERELAGDSLPWEEARLLAEVLERVRQDYVESVDDEVLIESAVRGMITDLDPHSQFLNSEEYEEIRISTTGNYSGVGLEVDIDDGSVRVVAPIEGAPAERAGIKSGDVIFSIDDAIVDKDNATTTVGRMRGKPGTVVVIGVIREDAEDPIEFKLVRSHVRVRSVRSEILESGFGYIRITHFSESTAKDLRKAIGEINHDSSIGLKGIVLDLRDNPGGVLEAAVEVADAFLVSGLIVTANGRGHDSNFRHQAGSGDLTDGTPLVVMVNSGSASASEIVAGALQDNDRATIVGRKTYGKGSVQTVMPLSNGRAIKLTTSHYFTPSGVSIQGLGITPDVVLNERGLEDVLAGTNEHLTDPGAALLQSDTQLREALQFLKSGRVLQSKID
jgi:carboxyl-terminal processing protease